MEKTFNTNHFDTGVEYALVNSKFGIKRLRITMSIGSEEVNGTQVHLVVHNDFIEYDPNHFDCVTEFLEAEHESDNHEIAIKAGYERLKMGRAGYNFSRLQVMAGAFHDRFFVNSFLPLHELYAVNYFDRFPHHDMRSFFSDARAYLVKFKDQYHAMKHAEYNENVDMLDGGVTCLAYLGGSDADFDDDLAELMINAEWAVPCPEGLYRDLFGNLLYVFDGCLAAHNAYTISCVKID